jgi:hypothetical protein
MIGSVGSGVTGLGSRIRRLTPGNSDLCKVAQDWGPTHGKPLVKPLEGYGVAVLADESGRWSL